MPEHPGSADHDDVRGGAEPAEFGGELGEESFELGPVGEHSGGHGVSGGVAEQRGAFEDEVAAPERLGCCCCGGGVHAGCAGCGPGLRERADAASPTWPFEVVVVGELLCERGQDRVEGRAGARGGSARAAASSSGCRDAQSAKPRNRVQSILSRPPAVVVAAVASAAIVGALVRGRSSSTSRRPAAVRRRSSIDTVGSLRPSSTRDTVEVGTPARAASERRDSPASARAWRTSSPTNTSTSHSIYATAIPATADATTAGARRSLPPR